MTRKSTPVYPPAIYDQEKSVPMTSGKEATLI